MDVWALPGKHQGEYDQVVVVAIKGLQPNPGALYQQILEGKANPLPLTVQAEPLYKAPSPTTITRFVFAPDIIDEAQGLRLIQEQGAWKSSGFQSLLDVPPTPTAIQPVVAPRPGHMALVLAAGVANGAIIDTSEYGRVAIRGKTQSVEQIARVEVEAAPGDPDQQIKKTTIRLKPTTILTLLAHDGTVVEMNGDESLLTFITSNKQALAAYLNDKFEPMYRFDFNGLGPMLKRIRLKGKYPLYTAQQHVVAAITRGFQDRDSILLCGMMGTGKTAMGSTSAIAIGANMVQALQPQMREDQVILIVAPPHLIEKWKRELHSIHSNIFVQRIDRHEDMKAFMEQAARLGSGIAKIGLIKRDMTKLGMGWEPSVVWRTETIALWKHTQPAPAGYEPQQRLHKTRIPQCPYCGATIMQEKKGSTAPATKSWLESGKRTCINCQTPLWQDARDKASQPKPGQKYPTKNPRYRLDEYLKRVYPDRLYLLIWDECHEAQHGDTGNGESFGRMANLAQKVLAMTGTPFNGRSSSLFNLEYHLNVRVKERYPWGGAPRLSRKTRGQKAFQQVVEDSGKQRGRAESRWVSEMGVREQVIEERPSYDSETGAFTGTTTYERPYEEAPGISPLLVAELLDHSIFFSLGDLGKWLPRFEEIALPVTMDGDLASQYDSTRQRLKDYLIQRRWEGDTTFRGAYLQWAMGWPNATHRPYEVIHNLKHPITGEKRPYTVTAIPSYGEDRVYAKEQALIDLLKAELEANRPCVVYLRQTATRDIQPRIEALIKRHVPGAKTYVLKNTVEAERREAVIEQQIASGVNVVICNPELVKTGLDLVFASTLIFYEIVFNLSTMMQAAARSYRLNQANPHCKVYYLFYEGSMEQTAVQLMSRKQRAAKLLTGDIGLTGLDALTEGEGGFEEALLDAIGRDETLLNPTELFKSVSESVDQEDMSYWNVEAEIVVEEHPSIAEILPVLLPASVDPLVQTLQELGGTLVQDTETPVLRPKVASQETEQIAQRLVRFVGSYLDSVHITSDNRKRAKLQAQLLQAIQKGVLREDGTREAIGVCETDFGFSVTHEETLTRWVQAWLKQHRVVFAGCEGEVAREIVHLAKQACGLTPTQFDLFEAMKDVRDEEVQTDVLRQLQADLVTRKTSSIQPKPQTKSRRKVDLLAIPVDLTPTSLSVLPLPSKPITAPKQLALF